MNSAFRPFDSLRRALAARRGLALVVALAMGVVQFALQSHLVEHDLLSGPHEVCEQCVVAKSVAPPAAAVVASTDASRHAAPLGAEVAQVPAHAPLVVRNRAPPSPA